MAKFYSNENFPLPAVIELRRLQHDVLTSIEAGQANQRVTDEKVIEFATLADRVVLTLNRRHFAREHRKAANHAGIVTCTVDSDYIALAQRVDRAIADIPDLTGQLIRVTRPS